MTKEEIQALIDATIAGQGSAIDAGGKLPAILSGILELATAAPEPQPAIVIEGTVDAESGMFTPTDPAYTYDVVVGLILAGRIVCIKYYDDQFTFNFTLLAQEFSEGGISFGQQGVNFPA